mmetsp:Transcript_42519/g.127513  ORF Transcript_42519/g.127513 Transcript_42519/m.127513 type:complete len:249 (-) Transcript_42519:180-926(-)|eukprot:353839-Chlamydomonas_euryale.AAC.32
MLRGVKPCWSCKSPSTPLCSSPCPVPAIELRWPKPCNEISAFSLGAETFSVTPSCDKLLAGGPSSGRPAYPEPSSDCSGSESRENIAVHVHVDTGCWPRLPASRACVAKCIAWSISIESHLSKRAAGPLHAGTPARATIARHGVKCALLPLAHTSRPPRRPPQAAPSRQRDDSPHGWGRSGCCGYLGTGAAPPPEACGRRASDVLSSSSQVHARRAVGSKPGALERPTVTPPKDARRLFTTWPSYLDL